MGFPSRCGTSSAGWFDPFWDGDYFSLRRRNQSYVASHGIEQVGPWTALLIGGWHHDEGENKVAEGTAVRTTAGALHPPIVYLESKINPFLIKSSIDKFSTSKCSKAFSISFFV